MKLPGENILSKLNDRFSLKKVVIPFTRKNKGREISKENTLCLFCNPRGGSTWLAEILMNIPGSVLIDEPLWRGIQERPWAMPNINDGKVNQLSELGFFYNQYIPQHESWPKAKHILKEILTGSISALSLYDEQDLSRLKNDGLYITKFCYANLVMTWLVQQFEFNSILLTRHPCAVISSQLKHSSWQQLEIGKSQEFDVFPFSDFYKSAMARLGKLESVEMYLALIWALGFRETAMYPANNEKWLTISYESLVLNFQSEIKRINERFGFELIAEAIDKDRPSKAITSNSKIKIVSGSQLNSWQSELTIKQIDDILKVLDALEIDIYGSDPEPDYSRLYLEGKVS